MHNRLESYLRDIETHLRSLPEHRRESDLIELRQHLESLIAAHIELECEPEEAVTRSIQQFGPAKSVAKSLVRTTRRGLLHPVGTRLCIAGWLLFLISMALPTLHVFAITIRGVVCAMFSLTPEPTITTRLGALYYHSLGAANIVLFLSPLLCLFPERRRWWATTALLGAAAVAITPMLFDSGWAIGFYAWFASFLLTGVGSLLNSWTCSAHSRARRVVEIC